MGLSWYDAGTSKKEDENMSTTAMLVAFISLLRLALLAGIVYLAVLLVRALRKYIRTQDARK